MSDTQAERNDNGNRRGLKLWAVVLVALVAGAAGGLAHACWVARGLANQDESDREARGRAKGEPLISKGSELPVTGEELGIRGSVRRIVFPPGHKVRVIRRLWCNGMFEPLASRDEYVRTKDANAAGEFSAGVRTFDSSALYRDANRLVRVTLYDHGPSLLVFWGRLGMHGGRTWDDSSIGPLVLEAGDVGKNLVVSAVSYGESGVGTRFLAFTADIRLIWTKIPTAADLKEADLFTAVWVRLERTTPEDQTKDWSGGRDLQYRDAEPNEPGSPEALPQEARPRGPETKP